MIWLKSFTRKFRIMKDKVGNKRTRSVAFGQTTLLNFYDYKDSNNRINKTKQAITEKLEEAKKTPAPVVIPYRDDGYGGGAFYDHYAMQLITGTATVIPPPKEEEDVKKSLRHLIFHLQNHVTHNLKFGKVEQTSRRNIPEIMESFDNNLGLLVIPGVARNTMEKRTEEFDLRVNAQKKLVKQALLIGQPILGICGGSWMLWEAFDGKIRDVKGHNCRSGMPRIKDSTGKIGHNIQVHRIKIEEDAFILKAALDMQTPLPYDLPVNSVHWKAPDDTEMPDFYIVSARSVKDDEIAPHKKDDKKVCPEENTVESFESQSGAPILGIQWHAEAYTNNANKEWHPEKQQHLLKYMVQAGQAFKSRRNLVKEFSEICRDEEAFKKFKETKLKKTGLLNTNFNVVKDKKTNRFKLFTLNNQHSLRHLEEAENEIKLKNTYFALATGKRETNLSTFCDYFRVSDNPVKKKRIEAPKDISPPSVK